MTGSDFRGFIPDGNLCRAHARASLRRPRELRCLSITIIANAATVRGALDSTPSGREWSRRSSWTLLITLHRERSSCFPGNIRLSLHQIEVVPRKIIFRHPPLILSAEPRR